MATAIQIVKDLNEVQVVKMAKFIDEAIVDSISEADLVAHADDKALQEVRDTTAGDPATRLSPDVSIDVSRRILAALAADPATAPLIEEAWQAVSQDKSLFIEAIVALGLIANLTLFMATTSVRFKVGGLTIDKGKANTDMVAAVLEPLKLARRTAPAPKT